MNNNQSEINEVTSTANGADFALVEDKEFFAPTSSDLIDRLIGEYQMYRKHIDQIAGIVTGDLSDALTYFLDGNRDDNYGQYSVGRLFDPKGAIAALNSAYWSKALALTDVFDCMPQERRDQWNAQISRQKTRSSHRSTEEVAPLPDFEETVVRDTLADLLASRSKFFAERVDGIFRNLSGDHVTNAPEAFGRRMIINYMLSYGSINHSRAGLINDLRCVLAKFMGRDEPKYGASSKLVSELYGRTGKWVSIDGGALRIRVYKKGTAHLEVHPDMAWRLNQILANLYPMAIPAEFRQKPKKRAKEFVMINRPISFAAVEILAATQRYYRQNYGNNSFVLESNALEKAGTVAYNEAIRVLQTIGGVEIKQNVFHFDYDPMCVINEICVTGCIPDQQSHQFYQTPALVAEAATALAGITEDDTILEPSAGQGHLAGYLPKGRTTCVEISPLHCEILKAKGFDATCADFITWADLNKSKGTLFSKVVMNPPFSEGRAQSHVEAASELVKPGGRLVAIVPPSMKNKKMLSGWDLSWSRTYDDEFQGTSVSVVILCATKP